MNFLPTINEQDQSVCYKSMEETNEKIVWWKLTPRDFMQQLTSNEWMKEKILPRGPDTNSN